MFGIGWHENTCYLPVTHWLFYQIRGRFPDYVARVDKNPWDNGRYMWRVFGNPCGFNDRVGWCDTLEDAQQEAERVYKTPVEKPRPIGQLALF